MGTPTARNVAPAGSEYAETMRSNHCTIDRENKQTKEAIQSDGSRTLEHCVPREVAHYPVGIWLIASADCMGGPRVPIPQTCSAGC
ncbi:hypothetical protein TNCV_3002151 [Trichonephila clavipes]|nr:hypothetical protein TNCV_3002151 [Trichonephila clavipes]